MKDLLNDAIGSKLTEELLSVIPIGKLCEINEPYLVAKGLAKNKARKINAMIELGKRVSHQKPDKVRITCSKDMYEYIMTVIENKNQECVYVVFLRRDNSIIDCSQVAKTALYFTHVDMKILMREILLRSAAGIILTHNHPSGNMQISESDIKLTKKVSDACGILDIDFLDHIITSPFSEYISFADENKML